MNAYAISKAYASIAWTQGTEYFITEITAMEEKLKRRNMDATVISIIK